MGEHGSHCGFDTGSGSRLVWWATRWIHPRHGRTVPTFAARANYAKIGRPIRNRCHLAG